MTWYGIKEGEGSYAVFDTFHDEAGRDAHLNGAIAKALMAKADELFSNKLEIHKIQIIADQIATDRATGPGFLGRQAPAARFTAALLNVFPEG